MLKIDDLYGPCIMQVLHPFSRRFYFFITHLLRGNSEMTFSSMYKISEYILVESNSKTSFDSLNQNEASSQFTEFDRSPWR